MQLQWWLSEEQAIYASDATQFLHFLPLIVLVPRLILQRADDLRQLVVWMELLLMQQREAWAVTCSLGPPVTLPLWHELICLNLAGCSRTRRRPRRLGSAVRQPSEGGRQSIPPRARSLAGRPHAPEKPRCGRNAQGKHRSSAWSPPRAGASNDAGLIWLRQRSWGGQGCPRRALEGPCIILRRERRAWGLIAGGRPCSADQDTNNPTSALTGQSRAISYQVRVRSLMTDFEGTLKLIRNGCFLPMLNHYRNSIIIKVDQMTALVLAFWMTMLDFTHCKSAWIL